MLTLSGDSKFPSWDVFNDCHAEIYARVLGSAASAQSRRSEWASVTARTPRVGHPRRPRGTDAARKGD